MTQDAVKARNIDIANVPAPMFRDPVYDGAADPCLIWHQERCEWWMFYTQRRAGQPGLHGSEYCYGSAIGVAVSKDQGCSWRYTGAAALEQPDDGENTLWAPQVIFDSTRNTYHMFVTYIKGVYAQWGGLRKTFHYLSHDLASWEFAEQIQVPGCIDASVARLPEGSWKMWYKDERQGSYTFSALSQDLFNWRLTGKKEIARNEHEGPIVFFWKKKFWMLTDMWNGLDCYYSDNANDWVYSDTILFEPGIRPDDNVMGRHADVVVIEDKAFVVYFTHPGRKYANGKEIFDDSYQFRRSSVQIAELELHDSTLRCARNKYA